jgi:hypothetical protein
MNDIQKEFVEYTEALGLKELGFDEPCLGYWRNENKPNPLTVGQYTTKEDMEYEISGQDEYHNFKNIIALAPTYSQAFRWFRDKHGLNSFVYHYGEDGILDIIYFAYNINDNLYASDFRTYEEAELACLRKLIEITNDK